MNMQAMEVGDRHADLWDGFKIISRYVDGDMDASFGVHETYGTTIIRQFGMSGRAEWWTAWPIQEPDRLDALPGND